MSRIEPIRRSRALVLAARRPALEPRRNTDESVLVIETRTPRTGAPTRFSLGAAAEEAAFEIHRLTNAGARGLKADRGVRRAWGETYAKATRAPGPSPCERARA